MRLEQLHVRRFRSLYDIELKLGDFSVLTGPNGSGKTNVVDALAFLGEVYNLGVEYAVGRAGGIDAIAYRDKRRTTIGVSFDVTSSMTLDELPSYSRGRFFGDIDADVSERVFVVNHTFVLKPASEDSADYAVSTERLSMALRTATGDQVLFSTVTATADEPPEMTLYPLSGDISDEDRRVSAFLLSNYERATASGDTYGIPNGASLLEWLRLIPGIREFQRRMSYIKAYRFNPAGCRASGVLTPNAALESDGGNLPAVVARMKKRERRVWQRVFASMRTLLPTLTDIEAVPSAEHGLVLRFQEEGRGRPWSAHEVSDGTIQALAMFAALSDSRPPMVVMEEPENTVHPWVLRRFIDQVREAGEKQVVLTTHSPVLLKLVRPEEVHLLWRVQGKSRLKALTRIVPDARRLYYQEGFDVFELYDSGLVAEAVPGLAVER